MLENIFFSIVAVVFLLILSGLFSGSETSITSVAKSKVHKLSIRGDKRAKILMNIINKKNDLISSLLIGNNFVNILASALATAILIKFYGDKGVIYSTIIMSLLIVIFSEVLPKSYALLRPEICIRYGKISVYFFKNCFSHNAICKICKLVFL